MRYDPAPPSWDIKLISGLVVLMAGGFLAASLANRTFLLPAVLLAIVILGCYLKTPVGYEISPEGVTIQFRLGARQFGHVLKASPVEDSIRWNLRLWGNGGLFAGTGIFWNRKWGMYRAYVTTSTPASLVLLETSGGKVLISPDRPAEALNSSGGVG